MTGLEKLKRLGEIPFQFTEPLFEDEDIQRFLSDESEEFDVVIYEYGLNDMISG